MANLTVKLDKEIENELGKIKAMKNIGTSAGTIKHLISVYIQNDMELMETHKKLTDTKIALSKLKARSTDYFHSMHDLMKECDFEQKL